MALLKWLEFMIENQEGLKLEHKDTEFPQWNVGYLEALHDTKNEIQHLSDVDFLEDKE